MNDLNDKLRDALIDIARVHAAFDGWNMEMLARAAQEAGHDPHMARAVFPGGIADALAHHAALADRQMLDVLSESFPDPLALRVRERIHAAVMARFRVLLPFREAERRAFAYWAFSGRSLRGGKILWRTADCMWNWAGDDSKDYNRHTKRGLLAGILGSAKLVWLDDKSADLAVTEDFVVRRIANVMKIGQAIGKLRKAG